MHNQLERDPTTFLHIKSREPSPTYTSFRFPKMYLKKEPCRNFQRGSCQYGDRCKFLHVTQQQPKSNAFGAPQQQPNPFGFGVQSNPQSKGIGNKQNQFKPFENKWSRQPDNQPQPANHKCTDPDSCKRIIAEDFEHERPLWKLTCYGHWKNAPCDIIGDISYEELRAAAYDDAKRGLNLLSIVERERNLLSSKLMEFDNLIQNPYTGPLNSAIACQGPFPAATSNAFSPTQNSSVAPSLSGFSQLGSSINMGFGSRPSTLSNSAFVQPNPFPNSNQTSGAFGTNNLPNTGPLGSQFSSHTIRSPFTSSATSFGSNGVVGSRSNKISPAFATHDTSAFSFGNQSSIPSAAPASNSTTVEEATTNIQLVKNMGNETVRDTTVWLKEKWIPGEIPEEAPPDEFV